MRDGVPLIGRTISISGKTYTIDNFYFVPGSDDIYVSLKCDGVYVNYRMGMLKEFLKVQVKL